MPCFPRVRTRRRVPVTPLREVNFSELSAEFLVDHTDVAARRKFSSMPRITKSARAASNPPTAGATVLVDKAERGAARGAPRAAPSPPDVGENKTGDAETTRLSTMPTPAFPGRVSPSG